MLTRVIKQLEEELDAKLIERTSKSFRLTDVGEAFYLQAQDPVSYTHLDVYKRQILNSIAQIGEYATI